MAKKEEKTAGAALPSAIEAVDPVQLMERLSERRDYSGALALSALLDPNAVRASAQSMLLKVGDSLRYSSRFSQDDASPSLGWVEQLIAWGADPFAYRGDPAQSSGADLYVESFFERAMQGGLWAYAAQLARASSESKNKAAQAVGRMNLAASPDRWLSSSQKNPRPGSRAQELMSEGGAEALALGFELGLDPDCVVKRQPWVFACKDAASVRAFAKAGFDTGVKNELGFTLPEAFARIAQARTRQEMQLAAVEALSHREKSKKSKASDPAAEPTDAVPEADEDSVESGSHIIALAPRASWREVERAGKAAGVDPLSLTDKDGNPLLALAVQHANWALASDLITAGADPLAVTGNPALPVALRALGAESYVSMGRTNMPATKRQALERLALGMINRVDFSWRDSKGRPPLEAFVAAYPGRQPGWRALDRWIELEPIDAANPLWARASRLSLSPLLVARAASREGEPWMTPGLGLLEALASEAPSRSMLDRSLNQSSLSHFMKMAGRGAAAAPRMFKLCEPAQWEAAIAAMWRAARSEMKETAQSIGEQLTEALAQWSAVAAAAEIQPFDMDSISRALIAGLKSDEEGRAPAEGASELVVRMGSVLCMARPFEAGVIVLDVLFSGHPRATETGYAIWRGVKASGADLRVPEAHPIFATPGAVDEKLANHPMWREIEEAALARVSKSSARMRL